MHLVTEYGHDVFLRSISLTSWKYLYFNKTHCKQMKHDWLKLTMTVCTTLVCRDYTLHINYIMTGNRKPTKT